ncbi:DUF1822 family protein [Phormidesmis sp. 146-12]
MTLLSTPEPLLLDILPDIHTRVWQQSRSLPVPRDRWAVYLNLVCFQSTFQWLKEKYQHQAIKNLQSTCFPNIYALVNGSAIAFNNSRLILIPTEAIDHHEFRVPQEWIDIPSWAGDYYLAVEVDTDKQQLQIWGYTTHQILKSRGQYDADDRTYSLASKDLQQSLSVLGVMLQVATEPTRAEIDLLPKLLSTQSINLIQRLKSTALPRLAIPFMQWGALIEQEKCLEKLCQRQAATFNLSNWLHHLFEMDWQAIEGFLEAELTTGFRHEDETGQVIQRVKPIALKEDLTILLLIILTVEPDERRNIRVRILPTNEALNLPENLSLVLRSITGNEIQSVQSRSQDQSIQLKQFKCPPHVQLQLQIAIDNVTVIENFLT